MQSSTDRGKTTNLTITSTVTRDGINITKYRLYLVLTTQIDHNKNKNKNK